jgi:hypothetical protein
MGTRQCWIYQKCPYNVVSLSRQVKYLLPRHWDKRAIYPNHISYMTSSDFLRQCEFPCRCNTQGGPLYQSYNLSRQQNLSMDLSLAGKIGTDSHDSQLLLVNAEKVLPPIVRKRLEADELRWGLPWVQIKGKSN